MALTPEQIKSKHFVVGLRGYDKDEVNSFLEEVADTVQQVTDEARSASSRADGNGGPDDTAVEATAAARAEAERITAEARAEADQLLADAKAKADELAPDAARRAEHEGEPADGSDQPSSADAFARAGEQVAAVLRVAEEQARAMRAEAEESVAAVKREAAAKANEAMAEADKYATETRTNAEALAATRRSEADTDRAAATRTLSQAQEQALGLVADAEKRAGRMLEATRDKAAAQAEESLAAVRSEYSRLRTEHAVIGGRLRDAHRSLTEAVENIGEIDEAGPDVTVVEPVEDAEGPEVAPQDGPDRSGADPTDQGQGEAVDQADDDQAAVSAGAGTGPAANGAADADVNQS